MLHISLKPLSFSLEELCIKLILLSVVEQLNL